MEAGLRVGIAVLPERCAGRNGSGASVDRLTAARRQKKSLLNVADTSTNGGVFWDGFFGKIFPAGELHQRL